MEVYETEEFAKLAQKVLSHTQKSELYKKQANLTPTDGKPLGPSYLKEFKLKEKRVYFITQGDKALFVSISDKKRQQQVIDNIRTQLDTLKQSIT